MYTFIDCVLAGTSKMEDISHWIENWFEREVDGSLRNYLGFTKEEYKKWVVEGDDTLPGIIENHRKDHLIS